MIRCSLKEWTSCECILQSQEQPRKQTLLYTEKEKCNKNEYLTTTRERRVEYKNETKATNRKQQQILIQLYQSL